MKVLADGRSKLGADSIERGIGYQAVIQLKGNVQISVRMVARYSPLSLMIMDVRDDTIRPK